MKVDLNCDLGESFGAYTIGMDEALLPYITSANVACGYHAGDPAVMRRTCAAAVRAGVSIGAHPGYPDLLGFGRRNISVSPDDVQDYVTYQLGALDAFCRAVGTQMRHVKPHGAMYNMAGADEALARAVCEAVARFDDRLILLGLSGSAMLRAAQECGLRAAREVFADRAYNDDGSLVNRRLPGAMIEDEDVAIARVLRMVEKGEVESVSGKIISIQVDSICVHGDNEHALAFVRRIREALMNAGVEVTRFS